jgi:hypothetical protein
MNRNYLIAIVVVSLMTAALIFYSSLRAPSDDILLDHFSKNHACFEKIVEMAREEKGIERISPDFVRLGDNNAVTNFTPSSEERRRFLSDERWDEYKALFRCAHIPDGISIGGDSVVLLAYAAGLAGSGQDKGYVWSKVLPGTLVNSLDGPLPHDAAGGVTNVYRHIEGPWYLEYFSN